MSENPELESAIKRLIDILNEQNPETTITLFESGFFRHNGKIYEVTVRRKL